MLLFLARLCISQFFKDWIYHTIQIHYAVVRAEIQHIQALQTVLVTQANE